jgi:hypothetical protein
MVSNRVVIMTKEIGNQVFRSMRLHLVLQDICQILARCTPLIDPLANVFQ